jgi:hypothetical protein
VESAEGQELSVLCLDFGYQLADTPEDLTRPQINFLVAALNRRIEILASARAAQEGVRKIIFTDEED